MKTLLTLPLLLLSLISFPSWSETMDDLVKREGLYYKKFSDVPFTGGVEGRVTGEIDARIQGRLKNGKMEGPWIAYWSNGHLWYKGAYSNGEFEGPWVAYWESGQLLQKGDHKNGKREGRWVEYRMNGDLRKSGSGVYKNGVKISD
jgi:hypothetical protein